MDLRGSICNFGTSVVFSHTDRPGSTRYLSILFEGTSNVIGEMHIDMTRLLTKDVTMPIYDVAFVCCCFV